MTYYKCGKVYTTQNSNVVVDTASGAIANFQTPLAIPLVKTKFDVNAKQDLHGYDHPWPAGGGKNLLPFENVLTEGWSRTNSGITAEYSNGIMHVYGTNELNAWNNIVVFNDIWRNSEIRLPAGTYSIPDHLVVRISEDNIGYSNKGGTVIYNNPIYVRGFYISVPANYTVDWHVPMMFVYGSVIPTTYEPYSNICPITGHTEANIVRTGKNLLSPTLYKGLNYNPTVGTTVTLTESPKQLTDNHDGTFSISTTANWETFCMIVPIKSTTYYRKTVISSNGALGTTEVWLDKNLKVISTYNNTDTTQTKKGLLSIPNNASYFAWVITNRAVANSTFTITQPQLELGSTATDYEPYAGTEVTVQFGQTIYKGVLDAKNSKVILTSKGVKIQDKYWIYLSSYSCFQTTISDVKRNTSATAVLEGLMCEAYANRTPQQAGSGNINGSIAGLNDAIRIKDLAYDNPTDFVNAMGDYLIVYPIAEPIIIDLPDGEPINTLLGTNNIYADTGDTSLQFRKIG